MNELRLTGDGSHTIFDTELNEPYHSVFGAITESTHVFIENGLHRMHKYPVTVFETGLGTGLNAYLTCLDAQQHKRNVIYYAIEKKPPGDDIIASLNYPGLKSKEDPAQKIFSCLHTAEWGKLTPVTPYFSLYKIRDDLTAYKPDFRYDLVYFDAFAPEKQPEMWTEDIFESLFEPLWPGGILVTYCAKGLIRRILRETGFQVELLAGPPGKRHMIRATKWDG